jgi:DNA-binding MarR family transcriptional regulator
MRWHREVDAALAAIGLSFSEWLVLDALRELGLEIEDGVNQNEIAARIAQERYAVSRVMCGLERRGLVDRGPDSRACAWSIFLKQPAIELLRRASELIEIAAARVESTQLPSQMIQDVDSGDEAGEVLGFANDRD